MKLASITPSWKWTVTAHDVSRDTVIHLFQILQTVQLHSGPRHFAWVCGWETAPTSGRKHLQACVLSTDQDPKGRKVKFRPSLFGDYRCGSGYPGKKDGDTIVKAADPMFVEVSTPGGPVVLKFIRAVGSPEQNYDYCSKEDLVRDNWPAEYLPTRLKPVPPGEQELALRKIWTNRGAAGLPFVHDVEAYVERYVPGGRAKFEQIDLIYYEGRKVHEEIPDWDTVTEWWRSEWIREPVQTIRQTTTAEKYADALKWYGAEHVKTVQLAARKADEARWDGIRAALRSEGEACGVMDPLYCGHDFPDFLRKYCIPRPKAGR